jgi:phosphatidylserine/phosphatidylglycerophosphate/cardiolipin synthase-like enzyme
VKPAPRFFLALLAVATASGPAPADAPATPPPPAVQLVETRPVETSLGNPALPEAHDVWLAMFRSATRTIDLEEFYLSHWPGEPTTDLLEALGQAAKRGVHIRLVLDSGFLDRYAMPAESLGRLPNFSVRWIIMKRVTGGGVQHSKYFIVDGRDVFVGSQNFDWRALKHVHELGVRARDPRIAAAFGGVFDMDWAAADTTTPPATRDAVVKGAAARARAAVASAPWTIVNVPGDTVRIAPSWSPRAYSPDTTHWDRTRIVDLMDGARHEIVFQVLTYSPGGRGERDATIDQAVRRAAARGVRVQLIVSDWEAGASGMASIQSLARVPNVGVKMGTVPEWSGGYIPFARVEHCKYMVVDTTATWVGTSNWDPSYFSVTRNLALTMWNRRIAAQARAVFEASWDAPGSHAVNPDSTYTSKVRGVTPPPGRTVYGN